MIGGEILSEMWSGKARSNNLRGQVDFIKDALCHDDWPGCDIDCTEYHDMHRKDSLQPEAHKKCGKPTESWVPDVVITAGIDNHEIPVLIMEIHSEKSDENRDQTKLQVMACSSLAFVDKVFGMLIKKTQQNYFQKVVGSGKITTQRFIVYMKGTFYTEDGSTPFLVGDPLRSILHVMDYGCERGSQ